MSSRSTVRFTRSSPVPALVLSVVGAGLGLLSAARPWVQAVVADPVLGRTVVTASGRQAAPVVPAVALVALAGGVTLLLTRVWGRRITGVVLLLSAAAGVAATVSTIRSPLSGASEVIGTATGTVGRTDAVATVTWWPWLAVAGGVLVAVAGAVAVLFARRWGGSRSRFESPIAEPGQRPAGPAVESDAEPSAVVDDDPGATWDALSRGEDPTRGQGPA